MRSNYFLIAGLMALAFIQTATAADYVVAVSDGTYQNVKWKEVADALVEKHDAILLRYEKNPTELLPQFQDAHPRFTCFVATRDEANREFVATVHQLTRKIDADPYTDTLWGVLTGFDAKNALDIAQYTKPLTVKKVASGTEFAIEMCQQGLWYDELVKNKFVKKEMDGKVEHLSGPDDTTAVLAKTLNEYQPDLFITSGHATERNWQLGFRYKNGYFKSQAGQLFGEDTKRRRFEVESPNAKVYLPIGNCLMGNIESSDSMALAWMNDVGVKQMIGYTVPTWFGYGGWGVLDYFVEQPGRYTLTEAFFANQQALIHAIETNQGNQRGLLFDRDVVAFYGDPKWEARMADRDKAYDQKLTVNGSTYTLEITPRRGAKSFEPVNTNGAQRGWRPIVQWLPHRIKNIKVVEGDEFKPVVSDDFILVPNPRVCDSNLVYRVVFEAEPID